MKITYRKIEPTMNLWQSRDGLAHINLFLEGMAFCWSGSVHAPIEVSPGASGEAVEYLIDIPVGLFPPRTPDETLSVFTRAVRSFLDQLAAHPEPEPRTPEQERLLLTAYDLLGDGGGKEWGDNPEYTRAIAELVGDTIGYPPTSVDRGGDTFVPYVLDQIRDAKERTR